MIFRMLSTDRRLARIGGFGWLLAAVWISSPSNLIADESIDSMLADVHQRAGVQPTPVCDDATFLRRVSLDLIGRVPTTDELREFLKHPDRTAAVDRLLASEIHPQFWSQLWTTMLVGRSQRREVEPEVLRQWMEQRLADEIPLDQIAFDLISAQGVTSLDGPVNYVVANGEDPVMRLSRTFLSVQLDCAQCHDHPYDRWTNDDYVAMKRFFDPVEFREVSGGIAVSDRGAGRSEEKPMFLTGRIPHTAAWRRELAWMVVQCKPFSRAMVNRTWYWLMGRGMIDPVDGLSRDNPGRTPELMEQLSTDFRDNGFRLRALIRRICLTEAYQRQPIRIDLTDSELMESLFASRTIRPMLPEQWIASVSQVLDRPLPSPGELSLQTRRMLGLTPASTPTGDPFDWTSNTQTLIRQLSGDVPPPLRELDEVYLATLGRQPNETERALAAEHRSNEILFALVHCNEFVMND